MPSNIAVQVYLLMLHRNCHFEDRDSTDGVLLDEDLCADPMVSKIDRQDRRKHCDEHTGPFCHISILGQWSVGRECIFFFLLNEKAPFYAR